MASRKKKGSGGGMATAQRSGIRAAAAARGLAGGRGLITGKRGGALSPRAQRAGQRAESNAEGGARARDAAMVAAAQGAG